MFLLQCGCDCWLKDPAAPHRGGVAFYADATQVGSKLLSRQVRMTFKKSTHAGCGHMIAPPAQPRPDIWNISYFAVHDFPDLILQIALFDTP